MAKSIQWWINVPKPTVMIMYFKSPPAGVTMKGIETSPTIISAPAWSRPVIKTTKRVFHFFVIIL